MKQKFENKIKKCSLSTGGVEAILLESGNIYEINKGIIRLNQLTGNNLEPTAANIYLRVVENNEVSYTRLIGVGSPSKFAVKNNNAFYCGSYHGVEYEVCFSVTEDTYFFTVNVDVPSHVEAEIYYALGDYGKVSVILNGIKNSEEPTYFILSSKIAFKNRHYQDALAYCQAYNERRPNTSPANYQLLGDCYTKLGKSGKAIKAYRKAEEIAVSQGSNRYYLSDKINKQEKIAEFKKEERDARNLGKKK